MFKAWTIVIVCAFCSPVIVEGKFVIGLETGVGEFKIDDGVIDDISTDEISDVGTATSASISYRWSNNIVIEGNVNGSGNQALSLGLTDLYGIVELKA